MPKDPNPEQWAKLETLFDELSVQSPQQRQQTIVGLESSEPELAHELRALLKHDSAIEQFETQLTDSVQSGPFGNHQYKIGQVVCGYRLLFPAHAGGQSEVWCATRLDSLAGAAEPEQFAVKFFASDRYGRHQKSRASRFRQEVELLSRLEHPNIAPLIDSGQTDDGDLYLVTPWITGWDLCAYCDHNQLSVKSRVRLFLKVLEAVAFAHRSLIVHRDIKPQNILVNEMGQPMLLDFGIAKLLELGTDLTEVESNCLTLTQERPMTLAYCSPEQIKSTPITTATDVYLCGLLAYELLTGHHPYSQVAQPELSNFYDRIVLGKCCSPSTIVRRDAIPLVSGPDTPSKINAQLNAAWRQATPTNLSRTFKGSLDAIIMRAIEKSPEKRFPDIGAFAQDLQCWLDNKPVLTKTSGVSLRQTIRKWPLSSVSIGVLATVALASIAAGWIWQGWRETNQQRIATQLLVDQQTVQNDELLGLESGRDRKVAKISHSVAMGKIENANKLIRNFNVSDTPLEIQDKLQLAASCLKLRHVSKGLALFSDIRQAGPDGLSSFKAATAYRIRYLLARLLMDAGWPLEASQWIDIPSEGLAEQIEVDLVAKLKALEVTAAAQVGHFEFASENLPAVLSPKVWQSLDKQEAGAVKLAQARVLGAQKQWKEAREILDLDSQLAGGFESKNIWYAQALTLAATEPGLGETTVELLLHRASDVLSNRHQQHPIYAVICFQLATLYNGQEKITDANKWIARAAKYIRDHSEWGIRPAFELVQLLADSESQTDEEMLGWLDGLQPYRAASQFHPYLNTSLAHRHLELAYRSGNKDQSLNISKELQRCLLETDPIDELYLLIAKVGERLCSENRTEGEFTHEITGLYTSLLTNYNGPARVLLNAAQDKRAQAFQNEMEWLRAFLIYRDTDVETQLHSIIYLATTYLKDDHYSANLLAKAIEKYLPDDAKEPSEQRLKWYKLVALLGDFKSIEPIIQLHLKSGSVETKDQCAEILVTGYVRSGRVKYAMQRAEELMRELDPNVTRLRSAIWDCSQWLKSVDNDLADQWNTNQ